MLKNKNTVKLKDLEGKNKVIVDINFRKEDPEVVKITMGDRFAIVSRKELFGVALVLGKPQEYEDLLELTPPKEIEVIQHTRAITVKATKDIKEGEEVVFNIQYEVPKRIIEYLGGSREVIE
jgi:SET domain-containing protein